MAQNWIVSLPDRLDAFLAAEGRMLSRVKAQKAIEEGEVSVNDRIIKKPAHRLQEGDRVELDTEEAVGTLDVAIVPTDLHLTILYEDDACFVIDKPPGIAVHPGSGMAPGEITILHGVAHLYKERGLPFSPDSTLVHRLDKDTTGCLLIAKSAAAHLFLQEQFENRTVQKTYLAIVAGVPKLQTATVDAPIGRSVSNRTQMTVFHAVGTREARTTYRVLDAAKNAALVECDLHTGRTHQVRVHLLSIGHPVLGDGTYGNLLANRLVQEHDIRSLCLHAWKLSFESPADHKKHDVVAMLPKHFMSVLDRVGIENTFGA